MSNALATLELKLAKKAEKLSMIRKENRSLRKKVKRLENSRDSWKGKNQSKGLEIKKLRHQVKTSEKAKGHQYPLQIVQLCVLLRVYAGASYRSICRILLVLKISSNVEITKIPCANTVQNWTQKVCFHHLQHGIDKYQLQPYYLIFDESISIGRERMLLILLCPFPSTCASTLKHTSVDIGLIAASTSWKATEVEHQVKKLLKRIGRPPVYILCDQGNNLKKAAQLLKIPFVHDITHVLGNCLRKVLKDNKEYKAFSKLLGWYGSKGVNQDLSYLRPPQKRLKARFLNMKPAIQWALSLLKNFDRLDLKARKFFIDLYLHLPFIQDLKTILQLCQAISVLLKNKGLNQKNMNQCFKFIQQFKAKRKLKPILEKFITLLEPDLIKYQEFLDQNPYKNVQVGSDVIESLFGFYKSLLEHNKLNLLGMLSLEIVTKCLSLQQLNKLDVKNALESNSLSNILAWRNTHMTENQNIRRMKFFRNCTKFFNF